MTARDPAPDPSPDPAPSPAPPTASAPDPDAIGCADPDSALTAATHAAIRAAAAALPLHDPAEEEAARRGRIAQFGQGGVRAEDGRIVWDMAAYDFLQAPCPASVHPALWRHAQLNAHHGLFEITPGVWQARGCDYANMTVIRGETGWILVDPLMTAETSAAVLAMVNQALGPRPVSAILVTHCHADHFAGLAGVAQAGDGTPIFVPEGFLRHAASEAVFAGNAMARRAVYQFGLGLSTGPMGTVDGGIGKAPAKGTRTFVPPTDEICRTGETRLIDGVRFVFQIASGTEAPAEFTFLLPDHKVLCMAEVCTRTMHNLLPPRGAQVRDPLLWARVIDEAIGLFAPRAEILINCHNWPVWGTDSLTTFLYEQRDLYKYIHDQTLRLANIGHTPDEIAALIVEPDWLAHRLHGRGFYGSLKFNARAVYQRYFGFYDGNPAHLDPLPPEKLGRHMIEAMGGPEAVLTRARAAIETDALQWAVTLLNHLIFAGQPTSEAKTLLARAYRNLAARSESGIQRNIYLMGAKELSDGVAPRPGSGGRIPALAATLSLQDWLDALAVRLNPERARGVTLTLNLEIDGTRASIGIDRQTEFGRPQHWADAPDATLIVTQPLLDALAQDEMTLEAAEAAGARIIGREGADTANEAARAAIAHWLSLHDRFDMWFNLVTP